MVDLFKYENIKKYSKFDVSWFNALTNKKDKLILIDKVTFENGILYFTIKIYDYYKEIKYENKILNFNSVSDTIFTDDSYLYKDAWNNLTILEFLYQVIVTINNETGILDNKAIFVLKILDNLLTNEKIRLEWWEKIKLELSQDTSQEDAILELVNIPANEMSSKEIQEDIDYYNALYIQKSKHPLLNVNKLELLNIKLTKLKRLQDLYNSYLIKKESVEKYEKEIKYHKEQIEYYQNEINTWNDIKNDNVSINTSSNNISDFILLKDYINSNPLEFCGIYILKNIENDKYYVGQSKNVIERLKQHFNINNFIPKNPSFVEDYCASNISDRSELFYIKTIPCKTKDELDFIEKQMIEKYNSFTYGYNKTNGND